SSLTSGCTPMTWNVTASVRSRLTDSSSRQTCSPSLHDALPIWPGGGGTGGDAGAPSRGPGPAHRRGGDPPVQRRPQGRVVRHPGDRKSTRLNSSHVKSSYAVFCLKKKKPRGPWQDVSAAPQSQC